MVSTIYCSPLKTEVTKAASPYVNIGCQCSPLTFVDQYGTVQGNCRSADSTGARWCYVDSAHSSSCQDLRFSARFPNNLVIRGLCHPPTSRLCWYPCCSICCLHCSSQHISRPPSPCSWRIPRWLPRNSQHWNSSAIC